VMIVGRSVASRLEVPEAIVLVVLGVLARKRVTEAGLTRLDQLAEAGEVDEDTPVRRASRPKRSPSWPAW